MANILVVEDEKDVQELIKSVLQREGYTPIIVGSGTEAIELLGKRKDIQLAIFDWMLPGTSGIDLCQQYKGRFPILMLTAREDPVDVVRGLDAGADDYLTKPFSIPVLTARVRALLRRSPAQSGSGSGSENEDILQLNDLKVDVKRVHVMCGSNEIKLTASEFKLLVILLRNKGKVLSRTALLKAIHQQDVVVVERVVDTQLYTLRKKLGTCGEVFESVRGIGYRVASS